jgi:glucans biosynthesis protein
MFFEGEADRRRADDFRPGTARLGRAFLPATPGAGEWIWRPLQNPTRKWVSAFLTTTRAASG